MYGTTGVRYAVMLNKNLYC